MLGTHRQAVLGIVATAIMGLAVAEAAAQAVTTPENEVTERETPYRYSSPQGNFQVTWPSGCGKLRIRANQPESDQDEAAVILVHHVSCDSKTTEGAGCAVTATFGALADDGGAAGPPQVLSRVRNTLHQYGVKIVEQAPVKREFEDGLLAEGVDVRGTGADGKGEFWVRGLLADHDIYVLTAWSTDANLWDNPEYQAFFNEFIPYIP